MELTLSRKAVTPPSTLLKLAFLFLLLFFIFPLMTSLAEGPTAQTDPITQTEQTLLNRINEIRASHGLHPLTLSAQLNQAADVHVADMQAHGNRSHRGMDGSSYNDRISRTGYAANRTNEAIGWGYNMERQISWWLNSPVHRPILLSAEYTEVGVGYLGEPGREWGHWWVLDFASPN